MAAVTANTVICRASVADVRAVSRNAAAARVPAVAAPIANAGVSFKGSPHAALGGVGVRARSSASRVTRGSPLCAITDTKADAKTEELGGARAPVRREYISSSHTPASRISRDAYIAERGAFVFLSFFRLHLPHQPNPRKDIADTCRKKEKSDKTGAGEAASEVSVPNARDATRRDATPPVRGRTTPVSLDIAAASPSRRSASSNADCFFFITSPTT